MATLKYIQKHGNQLLAVMDDGTRFYAVPTGQDMWYRANTSGGGGGPVDPGTGEFMWPIPLDNVTSEYGPRTGGAGTFHEGIDLSTGGGYQIQCAGAGNTEVNGWHDGFGWRVIIDHGTLSDGFQYKTLYAHMDPQGVASGAMAKGAIVGTEGNTGGSQGAHLHFEVHKMTPGSGIVWNTTNDGGYRTAINPRDFMAVFGA